MRTAIKKKIVTKQNVKATIKQVKTSNDINTCVLSLLSLNRMELKEVRKDKTIPISAEIIIDMILDNKMNKLHKSKFLSEYIKNNIEEVAPENVSTLKLEFVNSNSIRK